MDFKKDISIIIPAYNEAESLPVLFEEIRKIFENTEYDHEVVIVNDGSTDKTQEIIEGLFDKYPDFVIGIQQRRNFGKADALKAGFEEAQGRIVITMDADLQDDPKEIPNFISKINEGYDLVSGWKQHRKDSFVKNKTSKIYNFFTCYFSGIKLHDFNCGFKAYRGEIVKDLDLYGQLHRYIPVMLGSEGYKIGEIPVGHRKRKFGKTKYGLNRFIMGFLDLLTVVVLTKYFKRPAHFFGGFGTVSTLAGGLIIAYVGYLRLTLGNIGGRLPLLIFGILLVMVGVQLISLGLIGEMLVKNSNVRDEYLQKIKKIVRK
jgi:glycosyltransferase involved in cell wall biosynthesis